MPEEREKMDKELTFTPVIGIEIHIQLKTDTKIFCGCSTNTGGEPNTHICPAGKDFRQRAVAAYQSCEILYVYSQ